MMRLQARTSARVYSHFDILPGRSNTPALVTVMAVIYFDGFYWNIILDLWDIQ